MTETRLLREKIIHWSTTLGFNQTGFTTTDLGQHETHFLNWLDANFHGEMEYMQRHADLRVNPAQLQTGTVSIISVRMNYLPKEHAEPWSVINNGSKAYISRYALGRDYHKLLRRKLQKLANLIQEEIGPFGYRAFVDSAPVLEKAMAEKAGLGWIGKHSNLLARDAGSWFFLGELYTDIPIAELSAEAATNIETNSSNHCGHCTACIDICPTRAIVEPYVVDARKCISYLTIELRTSIPVELRPMIGNRIYGCDDCQLVCPWNKFLQHTCEKDFHPRNDLDNPDLLPLFTWTEEEFLHRTEGSAIRRIGYDCWQRNIAVAMGNAPRDETILQALQHRAGHPSEMVREHILWAIDQQLAR